MMLEYLAVVVARQEMEEYLALDGRPRPDRSPRPARTRRATASLLRRAADVVDPNLARRPEGIPGA